MHTLGTPTICSAALCRECSRLQSTLISARLARQVSSPRGAIYALPSTSGFQLAPSLGCRVWALVKTPWSRCL